MRRLWLYLGLLLAAAVSFNPVSAHAELVEAAPPPGSTVASLSEIRLKFSEPIGPDGLIQLHQNFVPAATLEPKIDPDDPTKLVTAVPPLADGAYTVQWSVTSADGHPISGSYSLGLNSSLAQPEAPFTVSNWPAVILFFSSLTVVAFLLRRWLKPTSRQRKKSLGD